MMLQIIGVLLSGVLSGGATGLIGIGIQRFFDMKAKSQEIEVVKLNHANALALKQMDLDQESKRVEGQVAVAEQQKEASIGQAEAEERARDSEVEAKMFEASVSSDKATYSVGTASFMMLMVDWVRGMTRPVLTAYLVIITHLMFNWVRELAAKHGEVISAADLKDIITLVLTTLLYLATVAVVWWFGTRPSTRK